MDFVGGYAHNMKQQVAQQNLVATTVAAVTVVRIVVPMVGRFVLHLWDKATGIITKDEKAQEVEIPENIAENL